MHENNPRSFAMMAQARQLMDEGCFRESLILALDALLQELNNLREALLALKEITLMEVESTTPDLVEEWSQHGPYWLPAIKPRDFH